MATTSGCRPVARGRSPLSGRSFTVSWTRLLPPTGDEQQKKWNECFDIIADNAVLYPVVHVKTVSASWDDPSTAPNGEALDGFKGIGTTSMSFRGVATVKA